MMMFETSKHVPKTEKRCCVFENNHLDEYLNLSDTLFVLLKEMSRLFNATIFRYRLKAGLDSGLWTLDSGHFF